MRRTPFHVVRFSWLLFLAGVVLAAAAWGAGAQTLPAAVNTDPARAQVTPGCRRSS
jgi:hypothetical protein